MAAAIGEPRTDPHGAPIPTRDGRVDERRHVTLADIAVGTRARIVRVEDEDAGLLRYLTTLGIEPDVVVRVSGRAPYDGPLDLEIDGRRRHVGASLAARLQVEAVGG